jgi:hypothetical protein
VGEKPRAGLETCPRCKNEKGPVKGIEVYNGYVYVFHGYEKVDGKWRKVRCYLGPVSEYKYVTRLHRDFEKLTLLGLAEVELDLGEVKKASLRPRAVAYLKQLLKYIRENAQQLSKAELEEVVRELEAALAELKKLVGSEDPAAQSSSKSPVQSKSEKRYVVEMDRRTAMMVEDYASTLKMSVAEAIEDALEKIFGLVFLRNVDFRVREL